MGLAKAERFLAACPWGGQAASQAAARSGERRRAGDGRRWRHGLAGRARGRGQGRRASRQHEEIFVQGMDKAVGGR